MLSDEVVIVPYPDGPYVVRGTFSLRDHEGATIETNRRVVALCRCGKSRLRPFCDGTHQLIRSQAASGRESIQVSRPRPAAAHPRGSQPTTGHGTDSLPPPHRFAHAFGDGEAPAQIAAIGLDLSRVQRNLAQLLPASRAGKGDSAVAEAAALLAAAVALLKSGDSDG